MKLKNIEIIKLYNSLQKLGNLKGVKFSYSIARNIDKLTPIIKSLQDAAKPTEEYIKYDKERAELAEKHAKKNKDGKPNIETNIDNNTQSYQIEDQEKFEKELKKLQSKYKKEIDYRNKQIKEQTELLEEESNFVPYKIKQKNLPEDISVEQLSSIFQIIEDENN
jgi:hypothetical protein